MGTTNYRGRELYEEARRAGLVDATCDLGVLYRQHGDLSKAKALWEQARRGGHAGEDDSSIFKLVDQLQRGAKKPADIRELLDVAQHNGQ